MSRAKNPKYESMSLEELKANMEKSKKELEHAIHNKNILEQRKKLVERKERSHRLIVKGAEFEKAFPLSRDLEQEEVQDVMKQLQNSSYNKSIVRQVHIAALHKEQGKATETKLERGAKLIRELLADKKEISIRELDEKAKEQGISGRTMRDVRSRMKNELEYQVNEKQENSIRLKE